MNAPACTSFLTKRDTSKSQQAQAMVEVHHPAWDLLREDLVPNCAMDPIFLYKEKEDSGMGYCPTVAAEPKPTPESSTISNGGQGNVTWFIMRGDQAQR